MVKVRERGFSAAKKLSKINCLVAGPKRSLGHVQLSQKVKGGYKTFYPTWMPGVCNDEQNDQLASQVHTNQVLSSPC